MEHAAGWLAGWLADRYALKWVSFTRDGIEWHAYMYGWLYH